MWLPDLSPLPRSATEHLSQVALSYPDCVETNMALLPLSQSPILPRMTYEPVRKELITATSQLLLCWTALITELLRTACHVPNSQVCATPPPTSPLLSLQTEGLYHTYLS